MFDFGELNALIGTPEMLARGRAYEGAEPGERPDDAAGEDHQPEAERPEIGGRGQRRVAALDTARSPRPAPTRRSPTGCSISAN
jgi:hypothetical protein